MASSSPLDREVKGALLRDVFNGAGYLPPTRRGPTDATPWRGRPLTPEERAKHAFFVTTAAELVAAHQLHRILAELTDDDVAMLLESADERARLGPVFARVFPAYAGGAAGGAAAAVGGGDPFAALLYTEPPRYYNLLLAAWEQHWAAAPEQGWDSRSVIVCARLFHSSNFSFLSVNNGRRGVSARGGPGGDGAGP
jgi:hypothetical protein